MTQDLTKITTPFGMLDGGTQNALKAAFLDEKELQFYGNEGFWKTIGGDPSWFKGTVYRVKPEPVTVSMWANVYPDGCGCSHDSRKMADRGASTRRIAVLRIDITDGEVTFHKEAI